jgi:hypothetical protein
VSFKSFAVPEFWKCYDALPENTQALAHAKFALFEQEPFHPSLGLKQKGEVWTVDVGRRYRPSRIALATSSIGSGSVLTRPTTSSCGA